VAAAAKALEEGQAGLAGAAHDYGKILAQGCAEMEEEICSRSSLRD
jgi:hypothetical protein